MKDIIGNLLLVLLLYLFYKFLLWINPNMFSECWYMIKDWFGILNIY
jgi:hypothetical protein